MNTSTLIKEAETKLKVLDPILGALITSQGPVVHTPRGDYFYSLCRSIIGQQVSVASATAIFTRFEKATALVPATVAHLSDEQAKAIGLSRQKTSYLRDLSSHFVDNPEIYDHLGSMTDEEVAAELTAVKGIGIWTAQMFLMFNLARLDVFAVDDIGLQRAMKLLYRWDTLPSKPELEQVADKWRPYRTVASWHLWKSLHNSPVG